MNIYRYYYDRLPSDTARLMYCEIYDGLMNMNNVIVCEYISDWKDCYEDVINALWMDNTFLTIFWNNSYVHFDAYEGDEIIVTVKYYYDKDKAKRILKECQNKANKILRESGSLEPDIDDVMKVVRIHDHLSLICRYDNEAKEHPGVYLKAYTAEGCLLRNCCVCEGSAVTFKLLCDAVNIPCVFVAGILTDGSEVTYDEENHAWCCVFVMGDWWHVDISQDIANTVGGNICTRWLLLSEQILNVDHMGYTAPKCRIA